MFIYWDCKILSGTATSPKRGVLDCKFQNPSEIPGFLCMTCCLIVRYKCMKFQPNSFNSVQLTECTQNCIYLCYKGGNLKNRHARVMVLVYDMPS